MARCVLCVRGVDNKSSSLKLAAPSSSWRQDIGGLCQLLTTPPHRLESLDGIANLEDGNCDLCSSCLELIHEMKIIQTQINQLQLQIGKRIVLVRNKVLNSMPKCSQILEEGEVEAGEMQRLGSIRAVLLRVSRTAPVQDPEDNFGSAEDAVKIEADDSLGDKMLEEPCSMSAFLFHPDGPSIKKDDYEEEEDNDDDEKDDNDDEKDDNDVEKNDNDDEKEEDDEISDLSFVINPLKQRKSNVRRTTRRKAPNVESESDNETTPPKKKKRPTLSKVDKKTNIHGKRKKFKHIIYSTSESESENRTSSGSDCEGEGSKDPEARKKKKRPSRKVPGPCRNCDEKFRTWHLLRTHHKEEHAHIPFMQCNICKKNFIRPTSLISHMFVVHETETKAFTCGQCGKGFTLESNFTRHVELHEVEKTKPVVCKVCDTRFSNQARLDRHFTSHTRTYRCDICSYETVNGSRLARHKRTHTGEKPVKCLHCDERFIDHSFQISHMKKAHSTVDDLHICSVCGKGIKSAHSFKLHVDRHAGIVAPKVPCDICGEEFLQQQMLQTHMIVHLLNH